MKEDGVTIAVTVDDRVYIETTINGETSRRYIQPDEHGVYTLSGEMYS